jgi:hypothetical protein
LIATVQAGWHESLDEPDLQRDRSVLAACLAKEWFSKLHSVVMPVSQKDSPADKL